MSRDDIITLLVSGFMVFVLVTLLVAILAALARKRDGGWHEQ